MNEKVFIVSHQAMELGGHVDVDQICYGDAKLVNVILPYFDV